MPSNHICFLFIHIQFIILANDASFENDITQVQETVCSQSNKDFHLRHSRVVSTSLKKEIVF